MSNFSSHESRAGGIAYRASKPGAGLHKAVMELAQVVRDLARDAEEVEQMARRANRG